jgi:hypothetical protein
MINGTHAIIHSSDADADRVRQLSLPQTERRPPQRCRPPLMPRDGVPMLPVYRQGLLSRSRWEHPDEVYTTTTCHNRGGVDVQQSMSRTMEDPCAADLGTIAEAGLFDHWVVR